MMKSRHVLPMNSIKSFGMSSARRPTLKFSVLSICLSFVSAFCSVAWSAANAMISVETEPLKVEPRPFSKSVVDLPAGTKVVQLGVKGTYAKVSYVDSNGKTQIGYVRLNSITQKESVMANIGKGSRVNVGATKESVAAAVSGKGKSSVDATEGFLDSVNSSVAGATAANTPETGTKVADLDSALGSASDSLDSAAAKTKKAAGSGKQVEAGVDDMLDGMEGETLAPDAMAAEAGLGTGKKAKSASGPSATVNLIEKMKVSDEQIAEFMKQGGLKSRVLK